MKVDISSTFLLWIFGFGLCQTSLAQNPSQGKSYAVVVGITKYKTEGLSTLQFADRDAALFATYLQSKAGGNVPVENIKMLLNEDASIAAIYDAMNWLQERCGPNDKAYFYFSGHGDVETENKFSLGYLLAYNSPRNNYRNNAIAIEDLNQVANHLSTEKNATVVLVTDACHTGKLAGDYYKGKQLVARQLQLILNNEIRLAACGVNETAAESEDWGGGRGIFSYYLLQGLNGMADLDQNDTIQLQELNRYLDSSFIADKVLIRNAHKQRPELDGNPYQTMAIANSGPVINLKSASARKINDQAKSLLQLFEPVGVQPIDYLFTLMKTQAIESKLRFSNYVKIAPDSLPLRIVDDCIAYQQQLNRENDSVGAAAPGRNNTSIFAKIDSLQLLKNQFLRSRAITDNFNKRFVQMVHGLAQDMINAYLDGDLDELEKREYYYAGERKYTDFVEMLRVALQVASPDDFLYQVLAVQEAYISGLTLRLEMVTARNNMQELLTKAFTFQQKAMKLEPYAAYIHNEMGNLYMLRKKYELADQHFNTARELSPTWAIPWSNKIRVGLATGNLKSALEAVQMADSLQHDLSYSFVNAGMVMEKHGDLLAAESYFQKGIKANGRHFLPYERLGNIYISTGDYEKADWYLTQATRLKKGLYINMDNFVAGVAAAGSPPGPPTKWYRCDMFREVRLPASKPYMRLVNAFLMMDEKPDSALQILKSLALRPGDMPLLQHYLGKTLYNQQKWSEAEPRLLQAINSYKSDSALSAFIIAHLPTETEADTCLLVRLMDHQYNVLQDHYLLARIYEQLGQPDKALDRYEIIMTLENNNQKDQAAYRGIYAAGKNPMFLGIREYSKYGQDAIEDRYRKPRAMGGYIKIANIYERSGNYLAAEKVYLKQVQLNLEAGNIRATLVKAGPYEVSSNGDVHYRMKARRLAEAATFAFYQRMLRLFPRDTEWQEKTGLFLYDRLSLVFQNVPAARYELAYEILNKYAFPFPIFYEEGRSEREQQERVTLPGTEEIIIIPTPKYDPASTSLEALKLAVKLSGDLQPKLNLLEAIADLNSWMGNRKVAFEAYKELVGIQEPDAALRNKIIDYCFAINESGFALEQLQILYKQGQTTQAQNLQLANCYVRSGLPDRAATVLKNIKPANSAQQTEISLLSAKANLPTGRKTSKLDYLNTIPKPDTTQINQDSIRLSMARYYYSLARLHALEKQNADALPELNNALKNGFTSEAILETDPAWKRFRKSKKWKALMSQYPTQPGKPMNDLGRTEIWYEAWGNMIAN